MEFDEMSKGEDDDDFPSSAEEGDLFQPSANETTDAEHIPLCLPSLFGQAWCDSNCYERPSAVFRRTREAPCKI
jgi:hypothetical protein